MTNQQVANVAASYQALALMLCDVGKVRVVDDRLVEAMCSKSLEIQQIIEERTR